MDKRYFPADKEGTRFQRAQYWLEKAVAFESDPNLSVEQRITRANMAFNMALKMERGE